MDQEFAGANPCREAKTPEDTLSEDERLKVPENKTMMPFKKSLREPGTHMAADM